MNQSEFGGFLDRPHLAVVATTRRDGAPHSVPVWYRYDGGRTLVWSGRDRAWVRHVPRDSRISVSIAEVGVPFGAVLIYGTASYHEDEGCIAGEIRAIAGRYLPADEVEAYIAQWSNLIGMVANSLDRVVSWERGY